MARYTDEGDVMIKKQALDLEYLTLQPVCNLEQFT